MVWLAGTVRARSQIHSNFHRYQTIISGVKMTDIELDFQEWQGKVILTLIPLRRLLLDSP